jgi:hypothetical protein
MSTYSLASNACHCLASLPSSLDSLSSMPLAPFTSCQLLSQFTNASLKLHTSRVKIHGGIDFSNEHRVTIHLLQPSTVIIRRPRPADSELSSHAAAKRVMSRSTTVTTSKKQMECAHFVIIPARHANLAMPSPVG